MGIRVKRNTLEKINLKPLYEYGKNIFSQNGEDGIIEFLFKNIIKPTNGLLLEVGAADGIWCSNIRNIYLNNLNYDSILIEANENEYKNLIANTTELNNCFCYNKFIEQEGENSLDEIIKCSNIDTNPLLISIDIDGEDYNVWKSLKTKFDLVIIETPLFFEIDKNGKKNINDYIELGNEKEYIFIGMSGILNKQAGNLFFLEKKFENKIILPEFKDRILLCGGKKYE
jgi:hypothetical protein